MPVESIAAFWAVSFVLIITPGADIAYVIAAGLRGRVIVPAVAGLLAGHLLHLGIVAVGVGALIARLPVALTVLTVVGCLYLVWLGVALIRRPSQAHAAEGEEVASARRWAAKGFGVSALNPKVFLLFLALLPQFVSAESVWPATVQLLVLGLIHVAGCAVVYTAAGFAARAVLSSRPAAARVVSRVAGGVMIVVATVILAERLLVHLPS